MRLKQQKLLECINKKRLDVFASKLKQQKLRGYNISTRKRKNVYESRLKLQDRSKKRKNGFVLTLKKQKQLDFYTS